MITIVSFRYLNFTAPFGNSNASLIECKKNTLAAKLHQGQLTNAIYSNF